MLQVALSCTLLIAAGLMIRSVVNLGANDYGFDTDGILTARVTLFERDYPDLAGRELFFDRLLRRLDQHPGVESAAMMSQLPVSRPPHRRFLIEGEAPVEIDQRPDANVTTVTPGVFDTFEMELIGGRDFEAADTRDSLPVVIVNQSFVERYLASRDPLGARIEFTPFGGDEPRWHTVVGVAPDMFMDGPENQAPEGMYVPLRQSDLRSLNVALRTRSEALSFVPTLRRELSAVDPDIPLFDFMTMSGRIRDQTWFYWVFGTLFALFGGVALLLASIGLYGVMAFAVRRRTGEIGIRMALGADAYGVLRLVLRKGLLQLGVGLLLGLVMAWGLAGLLEALLFNVEPGDPVTFGAITAALLTTGLVAIMVPARRAARTDPMVALRRQ
jgi:predicted permease